MISYNRIRRLLVHSCGGTCDCIPAYELTRLKHSLHDRFHHIANDDPLFIRRVGLVSCANHQERRGCSADYQMYRVANALFSEGIANRFCKIVKMFGNSFLRI